jgi:predicted amidophosphoribosyltransferase
MARYLCSHCHEVVEAASARFAFCEACGAPLTTEDVLTIQPPEPLEAQGSATG